MSPSGLCNVAAQDEPAWLDQLETEPLVERVGAVVLLLGIEDNLPDTTLLEIANRLGHQPRTDARTPRARMHRNTYQIAGDGIYRIELVANDPMLILGDDEIRIGLGY